MGEKLRFVDFSCYIVYTFPTFHREGKSMKAKQYIGLKIKGFRKEKLGISAKELGERLEPARSGKTISSWETGRTEPDGDTLLQLCALFEEPIASFYSEHDYYLVEQGTQLVEVPKAIDIPVYGAIAAGVPLEMLERDDSYPLPHELFMRYPKAFFLRVVGQSMNKQLPHGSLALVDPSQKDVVDNQPYALCVNGNDATIKRVCPLNNGYMLCPDSSDPTFVSQELNYNDEEADKVGILGRVVWHTMPLTWEY